jgi:hypothetical protein
MMGANQIRVTQRFTHMNDEGFTYNDTSPTTNLLNPLVGNHSFLRIDNQATANQIIQLLLIRI